MELHQPCIASRKRPGNPQAGRATLALAAGALLVLAGCSSNVNAGNRTATVQPKDITEQIPLNAQLVLPPTATASTVAPFQGNVERVYKSVGQYVNRGEPVVQIALPAAEAQHQQTRANLSVNKQTYQSVKAQWQPKLRAAQQRLSQAQQAVKQARQAAVANTSVTNPSPDSTGTTPPATTPGAPNGPSNASTDNTSANPDLQTAQQEQQQAQQNLQQVKQQMNQALAPYAQSVAASGLANQQARANANQGLIRAPISGTIVTLNAQPGQTVNADPKTPVVTIDNLADLQIQALMTPDQASIVKQGMSANVTFNELPGKTFPGTVQNIVTKSDGTYVANLSFANTDRQVQPTYHPHVGILTGRKVANALAVPAAAVDMDHNQPVVHVQRNNKWVEVKVTPGISDGQFTAIQTGVQQGQVVEVTNNR